LPPLRLAATLAAAAVGRGDRLFFAARPERARPEAIASSARRISIGGLVLLTAATAAGALVLRRLGWPNPWALGELAGAVALRPRR
jgi:hypothetical protein